MKRRAFLLAVGALAAPRALAQSVRKPFRIGYAAVAPLSVLAPLTAAFERGLRELGHEPGKDVILEYRSANGNTERYPDVVREVVGSNPDVIIAGNNTNVVALKAATQTIPVVMMLATNVVALGLVKSLARPGGNITGLTWGVGEEVASKRFQLLKDAVPKLTRIGVLHDAPFDVEFRGIDERAAATLGLTLIRRDITDDFERGFAALVHERIDAVFSHPDARQYARRTEIAALATRHRLPTSFPNDDFVVAGGLMSYGPNLPDQYRRGAGYVSKILKGAKPADLPIEQPVKIDLVVNVKTAKSIGLNIPQSLLLRADRVIE